MSPSLKDEPDDVPRRDRRKITPERATIIASLIALVGTLAGILLPQLLSSTEPTPEPTPTPKVPESSYHATASPTPEPIDRLSALELVDVSATERGDETVFLDVKIRNIGSKTSVLKRATAIVSDWRTIDVCLEGAPLPVSSTYKMTFPESPKNRKFNVSTEMHDSLSPNEATRVRIEVGLDVENPDIDAIIFRFTLQLNFDAEGEMRSDAIFISLPGEVSPPSHWEQLRKDPVTQECAEANLKNLMYMLGLPGRRSKDLQEVTDAL